MYIGKKNHDWGEPERAPHQQITHTKFVVDSVRRKLPTNTRDKPYNDDSTISMRCVFGAINNNTKSIIVHAINYNTVSMRCISWCYQHYNVKLFAVLVLLQKCNVVSDCVNI